MKLLLDTHVLLWRVLGNPKLSESADALIDDLSNQLFLSSVSGFEIAAKVAAKKLKLPSDVAPFLDAAMAGNQISPLSLTFGHTHGVANLPMIHRDPFDRLLIATAAAEGLTILTDDHAIRAYPVATIW